MCHINAITPHYEHSSTGCSIRVRMYYDMCSVFMCTPISVVVVRVCVLKCVACVYLLDRARMQL